MIRGVRITTRRHQYRDDVLPPPPPPAAEVHHLFGNRPYDPGVDKEHIGVVSISNEIRGNHERRLWRLVMRGHVSAAATLAQGSVRRDTEPTRD